MFQTGSTWGGVAYHLQCARVPHRCVGSAAKAVLHRASSSFVWGGSPRGCHPPARPSPLRWLVRVHPIPRTGWSTPSSPLSSLLGHGVPRLLAGLAIDVPAASTPVLNACALVISTFAVASTLWGLLLPVFAGSTRLLSIQSGLDVPRPTRLAVRGGVHLL